MPAAVRSKQSTTLALSWGLSSMGRGASLENREPRNALLALEVTRHQLQMVSFPMLNKGKSKKELLTCICRVLNLHQAFCKHCVWNIESFIQAQAIGYWLLVSTRLRHIAGWLTDVSGMVNNSRCSKVREFVEKMVCMCPKAACLYTSSQCTSIQLLVVARASAGDEAEISN